MTTPGEERWSLPPLTLADRCDFPRCGAPALLRVVLTTGDVYACAHDFAANELRLRNLAVYVQDERIKPAKTDDDLEPVGRMYLRRGLTHADPCRWCGLPLQNNRTYNKRHAVWRDYFECWKCDRTHTDLTLAELGPEPVQ